MSQDMHAQDIGPALCKEEVRTRTLCMHAGMYWMGSGELAAAASGRDAQLGSRSNP